MKAQAAALLAGAYRLTALLDRYGDATVDAAIAEIRARAAAQMRAMIATIPEGPGRPKPSSTATASSTSP